VPAGVSAAAPLCTFDVDSSCIPLTTPTAADGQTSAFVLLYTHPYKQIVHASEWRLFEQRALALTRYLHKQEPVGRTHSTMPALTDINRNLHDGCSLPVR
jgi:hypothetical protein